MCTRVYVKRRAYWYCDVDCIHSVAMQSLVCDVDLSVRSKSQQQCIDSMCLSFRTCFQSRHMPDTRDLGGRADSAMRLAKTVLVICLVSGFVRIEGSSIHLCVEVNHKVGGF